MNQTIYEQFKLDSKKKIVYIHLCSKQAKGKA